MYQYSSPMVLQPNAITSFRSRTVISYLRAATFSFWFLSLILHYWRIGTWSDLVEIQTSATDLKVLFYWGLGIAVVGHLSLGFSEWFNAPFAVASSVTGKLMLIFCFLMFILSPMSDLPVSSAKYSFATFGVIILSTLFWKSNYWVLKRVLAFSGFVVLAYLLIVIFKHGFSSTTFGGTVGSVNRNAISGSAVGGLICLMFSGNKYVRYIGIALVLALVVRVTSRGSLISLAVGGFVFFACVKGVKKTTLVYFLLSILVFFLLLAIPTTREFVFETIFQINSESRGLGSGLTGRWKGWLQAIQLIKESPWIGHGFRTAGTLTSAHNGYLRIFVDAGLIIGILPIFAIVFELFRRFKLTRPLLSKDAERLVPSNIDAKETVHLNGIIVATLAMTLTYWTYEPIYLNLGNIISILLFMFLVAPTYVQKKVSYR